MTSEEDRVGLVRQFVEVTGVGDEERARFYLEAAGWQLQVALGGFYEAEDPMVVVGDDGDDSGGGATATTERGSSGVVRPPVVPPVSRGRVQQQTGGGGGRPVGGGPMTLDALRALMDADDSGEDSDGDKQAFYAGGSESSGQQVLGPPGSQPGGGGKKNKQDEEIIADVFKKAREHGAEEVELGAAASSRGGGGRRGPGGGMFQGAGYKLGSEETTAAAGAASSGSAPATAVGGAGLSTPSGGSGREVVLRLWRSGFTVDGGGLRSYSDPGNMSFLESVKRGEVPRELIVTRGEEVSLTMEDRRAEDYVPPKPTVTPFQGRGNVLGSPCPTITAAAAAGGGGGGVDREASEKLAREGVVLTEGAPQTNIRLQLADGSRIRATFNHSHSVQDLHNFINTARPEYVGVGYVLTLFPSTQLTELGKTLEEANVLNAALIQKITTR